MNLPAHELVVQRADLEDALRLIRRLCRPKKGEEAFLSFDEACLHIECGGMGVTPPARGRWAGQVRVDAKFVVGMSRLMPVVPKGGPVVFRFEEGRLHVGNASTKARVQEAWSKCIDMPMNATRFDFLLLRHQHSREDIESAGYAGSVAEAEEWADRKVVHAADCLAELSVTYEQVRKLVATNLRKRAAGGKRNKD